MNIENLLTKRKQKLFKKLLKFQLKEYLYKKRIQYQSIE